jgi:L-methionine (R)-S-oxide reductase
MVCRKRTPKMPHKYLLKEFEDFARSANKVELLMQHVSQRIHMHIPRYNWVGFYLLDKKDPYTLLLGPHTGSFTPNPKISLDQGISGSAVSTRRTMIVDDVSESADYIKVSDLVKSQISVPVIANTRVVGVFNIESYFRASFKADVERNFAEACAKVVGKCMEKTMPAEPTPTQAFAATHS